MTYNLVIPAAGAATRLRPLSSNTSKAMVRVNGKPCIDYIIEYAGNPEEIVIVDGKFDDIRDYVSKRYSNVTCVKQESLDGPRDAIAVGVEALENKELPLVVWLGDAIILEDNLPLGENFLLTKKVDNQSAWCMWDGEHYYNKPKEPIPNANALVGLYSFSDGLHAYKAFTETDGYDISDALQIYTYRFSEIQTNKWFDIGETHTYYETCARLMHLKARAFNNFAFNSDLKTITKFPSYTSAESVDTIRAERNWYLKLTPEQSLFTPRVLPNKTNTEIVMSYEDGTLLSDLLLFDNIPESTWSHIIDKVLNTITKYFHSQEAENGFVDRFHHNAHYMWVEKSKDRIVNSNVKNIISQNYFEDVVSKIMGQIRPVGCMHGDLHFGNILYNTNIDKLTFIDPRGRYGKDMVTGGDNMYDLAKLAQDLYFGYNAMVHNVKHPEFIKEMFVQKLEDRYLPVETIIDAGWLLLATCIPLHYDDEARQNRFIERVIEHGR